MQTEYVKFNQAVEREIVETRGCRNLYEYADLKPLSNLFKCVACGHFPVSDGNVKFHSFDVSRVRCYQCQHIEATTPKPLTSDADSDDPQPLPANRPTTRSAARVNLPV
jgi:hypothetical protein